MNKNRANKVVVPVLAVQHRGGAMALLVAAGLHAILNWGWVKANFFEAS
jgi:hypothetical protein